MQFTLEEIHQTDYRSLNLNKLYLGWVYLKRIRFTLGELNHDQAAVAIEH